MRIILARLDGTNTKTMNLAMRVITNNIDDPTSRYAIARAYYADRMNMLERVANFTNPELAEYLLKGITEGWSYDILKARLNIPCCKDIYYDLYRRFFWLLDKERG